MKITSTLLSKAKKLAFVSLFILPIAANSQRLLTQDFNSSTVVSTYVGTGANQFDFIGASSPSGSNNVFAGTNKLNFLRNTGNLAIVKSTNLSSPAPTMLRIRFKLNCASSTTAGSSTFYVGSGLAAGATTTGELPTNGSRHSSFLIVTSTNASGVTNPAYTLRHFDAVGAAVNSGTYNGEQEINWFINNSGASIDYADLAGGTSTLADDQADLWVGNTRIFNAIPALTAAIELNNFKFLASNYVGSVTIDDIEITTGTEVLPITLASFNAKLNGSANQLTWATSSEVNNKGFYVQRQAQTGGSWEDLGFVSGNNRASNYSFSDNAPLLTGFYRLKQIDFDGKQSFSKVVSINQKLKGKILIAPNPATNKVTINLNHITTSSSTATVVLYDLAGKKVLSQNAKAGTFDLDITNLAKGIYTLTVLTDNTTYNEKIVKQ
jgi:Secretion system C-terminal sorting domain